ncbi:MAG: hypothetical protein GWO20_08340 [Candidatus Korarchaeota archaeon]|nr:hypothetical protein [Candidatus Korarchaeota archaeon]NIU82025.1 hypothetical protein [Candidatus Thorarchaeota archaeon]NIW13849.1 hypothetical protein [Candidatus Thorarchaeota archaeon]NIW51960.1 hypothetical protein [Candidatus Korarchaeota archaeon]
MSKHESLPNAKVGQIIRLVETLDVLGGISDMEGLAIALEIKRSSLHNPLNAAELIGIVITNENVKLTEKGLEFLGSEKKSRKDIFYKLLIEIEPFTTLHRALEKKKNIEKATAINLVKSKVEAARSWKESTTEEMWGVIVNWAEYADLFKLDRKTNTLHISRDL